MTGEAITGLYDYGDISESDKKVVNEIITLLRQRKGIPVEMIIEELKTKFELVEIPMKKIEDSVWGQLTKDERIGMSVQGFRTVKQDGIESSKNTTHLVFNIDLDYLDEFVNRLIQISQKTLNRKVNKTNKDN